MEINKKLIVIDWVKNKNVKGRILNLTLCSEQRKIHRGRKFSDCNKELFLQLPREGIINDGDIFRTNQENIFICVKARIENLFQIHTSSKLNMLKLTYHLGNRHIRMEINDNYLFVKEDHVIKNLLESFDAEIKLVNKKFFPEIGAFNHD